MNSVLTQTQPVTTRSNPRLARTALVVATIGALWFILCRQLSNEWSVNEQYSYGWLVPFFAACLFWLRWQDRPDPEVRSRRSETANNRRALVASLIAVSALLVLLPVRLFEIGNPDWRPLGWLHAAIAVSITSVLIWKIGGKPWLTHFAFPVAFIFVAVPWVSPIEAPIVQGLMRAVAWIASQTLNLCGVPAQLEGSLIRVNTGLVGVNEACSGVRSLQTSLMIGLLFGEAKRLSISRRMLLVCAAVASALVANCVRTFFLVWIAATRGLPAEGQWHDVAGYAIVAATFIVSFAAAALLGRENRPVGVVAGVSPANMEGLQPARLPLQRRSQNSEGRGQSEIRDQRAEVSSYFLLPTSYFLVALCWLLVLELGVHFWYRIHERDLLQGERWTVRWPESSLGFRDMHIDTNMQSTLRYDQGRQVAWPVPQLAPGVTVERAPICSMYFFRWNAGGASILRARAHRPDICLPNVGWRQISDHGTRNYLVAGKFALPFRHFSFARSGSREDLWGFAEAFSCMREDFFHAGEQQFDLNRQTPSDWGMPDRWRAVRSGLRNPGQQVLELVFISSEALDPATVEERFAKDIQHIIVVNPANL